MKTLFLLGGGGGIGSAIKDKFIKEGYSVVAPSSKELDLNDIQAVAAYFKNNPAEYDVFIHCAGRNNPALIEEQTTEEALKTFNINCLSMFEVAKHLLPYFKKAGGGHILGVSSLYGVVSRKGRSAYAMSKHAMVGLVQTMAQEFAPYNVKVNALAPGFIKTHLTVKNNPKEVLDSLVQKIPLGRLGEPSDMAGIAYFLCSAENTYITGQNIIADGGILAGGFENK